MTHGVTAAAVGALLVVFGCATKSSTATPIHHLVVIFQENVSFDHYFATYPHAVNKAGENSFTAAPDTPKVNGLTADLLTHNHNAAQPTRLSPADALTCDQNHEYKAEQQAFGQGSMDQFVQSTGTTKGKSPTGAACSGAQVMDYYDGNTVTALWNYAQHFAMSDASFGTTFGPSTPGALNLISGQTHGVSKMASPKGPFPPDEVENATVIGDPQPLGDDCSTREQVRLEDRNVGDLLSDEGVSWGWFQGGFAPTVPASGGNKALCGAKHPIGVATGGKGQWGTKSDYVPHHEPFQYYSSTANPRHLAPTSVTAIGHSDRANHQYDLADFWRAFDAGKLPAVAFMKAAAYQDGHAGYSDPVDEQAFLVDTINRLQSKPALWSSTAVVIAYDDSDGWYDHVAAPQVNGSSAPADALDGPGTCGSGPMLGSAQDRCGYGPRLPLLVVSPWARANYVDHTTTDQSSILRFIEDNWHLGRIGNGSFDGRAGSLNTMFDFSHGRTDATLRLNPQTGRPE